MMREGYAIARRTIERLTREMALAGVIRGKPVGTTISDHPMLDHACRPTRTKQPPTDPGRLISAD